MTADQSVQLVVGVVLTGALGLVWTRLKKIEEVFTLCSAMDKRLASKEAMDTFRQKIEHMEAAVDKTTEMLKYPDEHGIGAKRTNELLTQLCDETRRAREAQERQSKLFFETLMGRAGRPTPGGGGG